MHASPASKSHATRGVQPASTPPYFLGKCRRLSANHWPGLYALPSFSSWYSTPLFASFASATLNVSRAVPALFETLIVTSSPFAYFLLLLFSRLLVSYLLAPIESVDRLTHLSFFLVLIHITLPLFFFFLLGILRVSAAEGQPPFVPWQLTGSVMVVGVSGHSLACLLRLCCLLRALNVVALLAIVRPQAGRLRGLK